MNKIDRRKKLVGAVALCALPLIWAAGSAEAGTPKHAASTVTRTGPAGNSATRNSSVSTNGQGGYTAGSTVTGPAGNQASRQQSGAYNPATQTYTRSGGTTGPAGNSTSFSTSTQKTADGYQRTGVRTGPNGNSVTTTGQGSYDPSTGTVTQSRSSTGPNGKGTSESRTVTAAPTATTTPSN
jgi:hypothetical protein